MRSLLPSNLRLGPVQLQVLNLDRALNFYEKDFGLVTRAGENGALWLGPPGGETLLILATKPGLSPKPAGTTGLYHYALLLPGRRELGKTFQRLLEARATFQGAADHLVSEAIYLADPEGNGIEIYADRPREDWPRRGEAIEMATLPLDLSGLLAESEAREGAEDLPKEMTVGHVHLHVADLERETRFYREVLGFELMASYGASASFLAAGGYHHHVGINVWAGHNAPAPPKDSAGLGYFTILLPGLDHLAALRERVVRSGSQVHETTGALFLRDAAGNGILVAAEGERDSHAFAAQASAR